MPGGSEVYIVPGGQLEAGETNGQALVREMEEEFGIKVGEEDLEELGTFESPAVHHPGRIVRITIFLVTKWTGEVTAQNEIEGVVWVNSISAKQMATSPFTRNVAIPMLVEKGLID